MKHLNTKPFVTLDHGTEVAVHDWVTEASTLELPAGRFPYELPTNLGNGQPFLFQNRLEDGGARYRQCMGCVTLTVYND